MCRLLRAWVDSCKGPNPHLVLSIKVKDQTYSRLVTLNGFAWVKKMNMLLNKMSHHLVFLHSKNNPDFTL